MADSEQKIRVSCQLYRTIFLTNTSTCINDNIFKAKRYFPVLSGGAGGELPVRFETKPVCLASLPAGFGANLRVLGTCRFLPVFFGRRRYRFCIEPVNSI